MNTTSTYSLFEQIFETANMISLDHDELKFPNGIECQKEAFNNAYAFR